MPKKIREAATATRRGPGRILLTLISPGQGSSGDYTPEVLATAAAERAFPRGTLGMIDHDTPTEMMERPEGSLRNLAIVLEEDAYIGEGGALQAEAKVASAWRDLVDDFHEHIGASIFASAEISVNESGQKIVERIIPNPFNRADLVTVAGRGGKIDQVLEAAKVIESRSIVKEAMSDDVRMWLSAVVRDTHADDDTWAYLHDYDETYVFFEMHGKTFRQQYLLTGVNAQLTGELIQVRRRVEYDPVITPSVTESKNSLPNTAGTTQEKEGAEMALTLEEANSRVDALEAELKAEKEARAKEAAERATEAAANRVKEAKRIVAEAFGEDAPALYTRLAESVATPEDFDADKFRAEVTEAAAKSEADQGAGTPRGMGNYTPRATESKKISDDELIAALHGKA